MVLVMQELIENFENVDLLDFKFVLASVHSFFQKKQSQIAE